MELTRFPFNKGDRVESDSWHGGKFSGEVASRTGPYSVVVKDDRDGQTYLCPISILRFEDEFLR